MASFRGQEIFPMVSGDAPNTAFSSLWKPPSDHLQLMLNTTFGSHWAPPSVHAKHRLQITLSPTYSSCWSPPFDHTEYQLQCMQNTVFRSHWAPPSAHADHHLHISLSNTFSYPSAPHLRPLDKFEPMIDKFEPLKAVISRHWRWWFPNGDCDSLRSYRSQLSEPKQPGWVF